jgi:hypothetical protein
MQRLRRMAMTNPQDRFPGGSSGARLANMPARSRAFVTAISAGLCGLVGLLLGGYGVDLVRLKRPDFEYGTLLTAAIVGGLEWCAGAVVAWCLASARAAASRADVVLLVLGAVVVLWFGVQRGGLRRRHRRRHHARRTRGLTASAPQQAQPVPGRWRSQPARARGRLGGRVVLAVWIRSSRCVRSASSRCRACAMPSITPSETPAAVPCSSLVSYSIEMPREDGDLLAWT